VAKARLERIVNQANDLIALVNREYIYEFVNDAYCRALGSERKGVVGTSIEKQMGHERFATRLKSLYDRCFDGEFLEHIDTQTFGAVARQMHVCYYPYQENGDGVTHALVICHDVTNLGDIETRLTRYEFLDPVTGLFNRRSLNVILDKEIYKANRSPIPISHALLFISLREGSELHQTFGPEYSDLLIENSGLRVQQAVRESDYVFRFEGFDLTVLLTNITRPEDAILVAKKIHEEISLPYSYGSIDVKVDSVIGVAVYPEDGQTGEDLIAHSNSALVEAQRRGLPYCMYEQATHDLAMARITLRSELQRAFELRQFVLHYQPFVDINGTPQGAEALIRWNHPTRGLLMPGSFIDLAEETRVISAIDRWALFEVCRQLAVWDDIPDFFVSINISAKDLLDEYLVEVVSLALENAGNVSPSRLKLELTERISMDDPETSIHTMKNLIEFGVDVWIDDFGTGQSSLSYLKNLPAEVLKIDKVFIDQIADNDDDREYLSSIARAIRSRGKRIVIEGVSEEEQWKQLRTIECELLQGYYFSKAVGPDEIRRIVDLGVLPYNRQ
jgi:diguanylate cyclase (GGDEF)-like protein/PAS domain S-box-containing protein